MTVEYSTDNCGEEIATVPRYQGVLMGGSGSTGSSLLRTVLNRHPAIFSGEELNFFNKEQFFVDWNQCKHTLLGRHSNKMATRGFFPYPGDKLLHEDYGWDLPSLKGLVSESSSLVQFTEAFFAKRLMQEPLKTMWIEKTPSNCYSFHHFLHSFPEGKVVHTARNPLDAVASLVRRGMSTFFASGLWLYNSASSLSVASDPRYSLVKYESLVDHQQETLQEILEFLGVGRSEDLDRTSESDNFKHAINPGWRHNRTAPIQKSQVRTFDLLSEQKKQEVFEALSAMRISAKHAASKKIEQMTCEQVCQALDYEFLAVPCRNKAKLVFRYINDIIRRTWKHYPTGLGFYPIELRFSK